ncbi:MAG: amidohydrolase [Naasia sp.]|nr:amidohydrolase [Naasia sp.]
MRTSASARPDGPEMSESAGAEALLLRDARLPGAAAPVDVLLESGRIAGIAHRHLGLGRFRSAHAETVDLDGRTLIPGLWDEHVHFTIWAMSRRRLDLSESRSAAEAASLVRHRLEKAGMPPVGPLVGVGFRDAAWPDLPTRDLLDRETGERPVVLLSSDLHSVWLNTAAATALGETSRDALLREADAFRVEQALDVLPDALVDRWAMEAQRAAAGRGVVGIVDLEMAWNREVWLRRRRLGADALRVRFGVYPQHLDRAIEEGLRTGDAVDDGGLLEVGTLKVLIDGSLGTRTAFCRHPYPEAAELPAPNGILTVPADELEELLRRASAGGIAPTVHAIGDEANRVALDVYERVGIGGRIEHAQLLAPEDVARFAARGITASVQPRHAIDDRDIAAHHWAGRTDRAFPFRSLLDAGVRLAFGSDAPVSPLDPWEAVAAAVFRTGDGRPAWHPEQAVTAAEALAASADGRTGVAEGDVADLAILDADPLMVTSAGAMRAMPVAATVLGGRFTHRAL